MGRAAELNPLARGFYTVREAARLIEVGSPARIRGWLKGYPGRKVGPLLKRDYKPIDDWQELSFHDLLEVRFVEFFREAGVKGSSLRVILKTAREVFKTDKPLATANVKYRAEAGGRDVFVEEVLRPTAEKEKAEDRKLWSLVSKNYVALETIRQSLDTGVIFDPKTQIARQWIPRQEAFPEIIIDPRVAYGRPVTPSSVPTKTIWESWVAEDEDFAAVSDWFEIPPDEVTMAIEFEKCLTAEWEARVAA
jgi:uncharacterized protein (DUF433 family)